jgi:hypothetical protein
MPAPRGKLTDLPDISAYVMAHAAGIAWALAVNPTIFRSLVALGYRDHLLLAGIANSIVISAVVLLIFLLLRKAMAGSSGAPPPPADRPAPPPKFTDLPELSAYVLAHAAGIAWGATVTPMIFRSLIAQGARNLMPLGIAISIAVSIAVLLIFLVLRKAMAGSSGAPG